MSLTKQIVDELNRRDLSPVEREYGEEEFEGWPSPEEIEDDWFYMSNMCEDERFPFG